MDEKQKKLLDLLENEIEHKCFLLRKRKIERLLKYLFAFFCILFLVVPIFLVFLGFSLWVSILPVFSIEIFIILLLAPLLVGRTVQ